MMDNVEGKAENSQNNVKNNINEAYNGNVSHSLKNNSKTTREFYTEKEYRNFGWARANNILNAGQNADYRSKFAATKTGNSTFNKSKNGEYIIPVSNIHDNELEGVENVLVFAKGTITNPIITSVILINADNETDLSLIREYIYEREREGIPTEIEGLFKRYNSSDREFERQKGASGITHSERHENGSGSSTENSSIKEQSKVNYSLKDGECLKAVESGDTETVSKLVEEAAEKASENKSFSLKDSNGNTLTEEQQKHFTDSKSHAEHRVIQL